MNSTAQRTMAYLMLLAPWIGIQKGEPLVFHAVTLEMLGRMPPVASPCGAEDVGLIPYPWPDGGPIPWPPTHRIPGPARRCRECWIATGKPRPRAQVQCHDSAS